MIGNATLFELFLPFHWFAWLSQNSPGQEEGCNIQADACYDDKRNDDPADGSTTASGAGQIARQATLPMVLRSPSADHGDGSVTNPSLSIPLLVLTQIYA